MDSSNGITGPIQKNTLRSYAPVIPLFCRGLGNVAQRMLFEHFIAHAGWQIDQIFSKAVEGQTMAHHEGEVFSKTSRFHK